MTKDCTQHLRIVNKMTATYYNVFEENNFAYPINILAEDILVLTVG